MALTSRVTELNRTVEQLSDSVVSLDKARKEQRALLDRANEERFQFNQSLEDLQDRIRTASASVQARPSTLSILSASAVAALVVAALSLFFAFQGPRGL